MKLFVDTNVIVAAVASHGLCDTLLEELLVRSTGDGPYPDWEVFTSERVLSEAASQLARRLRVLPERVRDRISRVTMHARLCTPARKPLRQAAELGMQEADCWLLADAASAGCEYFITGDRRILQIYALGRLRVVTPREAMDLVCRGLPIPRHEVHEERAAYLARRLESVV